MPRILVVAHKTLGGKQLLNEVERRMKGGDCSIHLLVPVAHPMSTFSEASLQADAQKVVDDGIRQIRELDKTGSVEVTGEVGDANPVYAAKATWNHGLHFDEIIVSTLPSGMSRWLKTDVPSRLAKTLPVPVTHIVAEKTRAGV
ncbi:MAG: hypothetical protein ACRD0G_15955 [Acidimicrobiales bacterium]